MSATSAHHKRRGYVEKSIGLVTALVPVIGYEQSAAIAKEALKGGGSVYDVVLEKGLLSKDQLDDILRPGNMTDPPEIRNQGGTLFSPP